MGIGTFADTLGWIFGREGIFPRQRRTTAVEDKCPLFRVLDDRITTLTRGGVLACIVELRGRDYSGLDPKLTEGLFLGRKAFFESLPSTVMVFHQSHRLKVSTSAVEESFSVPIARQIAEQWAKHFKISYRTRHYLIFSTSVDSFTDQLQVMVEKTTGSTSDELFRILHETVHTALLRLKDYNARMLEGDEVASYWAQLLNGCPVHQRLSSDGLLDGVLAGSELHFPDTQRYQVYSGEKERYSAYLFIKLPATGSDGGLLDGLFKSRHELSIFQTFAGVDKQAALADVEDRHKNTVSFRRASDIVVLELGELAQRLQADEVTMLRHRWVIEVFGDNAEELERAVAEVRNIVDMWGYRTARERANKEAQFWSRFPEYHTFNTRKRSLTSENAAHFATFAAVGEGLDSCSWGNKPVATFKTLAGSEFGFTFHSSPAPKAPGHTQVFGGTNLGKTTLISFLLGQCFKFPDFRVLAFDRLQGLEVFTMAHDGIYINMVDGVSINPLQLPDNRETRAFLANWFEVLTGKSDDAARAKIDNAIEQLFYLSKDERTLRNLAEAFGLKEEGSIRQNMERWLKGPFAHFFTGEKDHLDFGQQLVAFDMTSLLDLPDVLAPLAYYLFHKLLVTAREKGGYAVFVDELPKYLASPVFAPKIEMMLQEIRKTDGVFIGAAQSVESVLNSPSADKFLSNIETYIFFPEPRASRESYMDALGLNQQEFHWLTQGARPREVLVKRKSGESTILNIDLSPLGKYLKAFDSSIDAVSHAKLLEQEHGQNWKNIYLGH
ncbi:hypothetical protein [Nitrosovibrio sp. Nv6]|uniref:VirB4 family type IV secretion/conjugal transfer ATPase n=1 Tax=Nitrosovibrio sp. Nv6 TaxID=1855340 RepID=UPI0008C396E1|nr:hypothetical protein [Nitrosovibrio sp. Nv6]SEP43248.1 type IV secretion/conjugal transfer ATPase, VirB4 family [Nitrosovibrio sp. Nv6]